LEAVENIDEADVDAVERMLRLVWGNQGSHIFHRLEDVAGSVYPDMLLILLEAAREHALSGEVPVDHLLGPDSIAAGLRAAAQARLGTLARLNRDLGPALSLLKGLPSTGDIARIAGRGAIDVMRILLTAGLVSLQGSRYELAPICQLMLKGLGI
jgi:hypothetical protein